MAPTTVSPRNTKALFAWLVASVASALLLVLNANASATVIDNFSQGAIGTPTGRLDTATDTRGSVQPSARDDVEGLPESDVLSTDRFVLVTKYNRDSDRHSTAEIKQTEAGDGYLEFTMGTSGTGLVSHARPDSTPLADVFGGRYDAFRFHFLEGTTPGRLAVSLRGDFPVGGNQIIANTDIEGAGWIDVPFTLLEGEFGGPTGPLGLPWEFLYLVSPQPGGARDDLYRFRVSHVSLVPEPSSCILMLATLAGLLRGPRPARGRVSR